MLKISKALNASQAQTYHAKEFTAAEQNYWKQGDTILGEWQGRLTGVFGLAGGIDAEHFSRLSQGQHPYTGDQLVRHRTGQEYTDTAGRTVNPATHRAGWDATFSAPKSVSLTALVGGDNRIRIAHREAVSVALTELERYVQARMGGNRAAETTGKFVAAKFEHDTARPVDGYAAPQLHTHAVIFNMTQRENGTMRALQERGLFESQQFATAVYQAELMYRLRHLGYEIQAGRSGAPEIKGYSQEYLDASSLRRQQIEEALAKSGHAGPAAAQIAAHNTRDKKQLLDPDRVLAAHQQLAASFGNQADRVVAEAQSRAQERSQGAALTSDSWGRAGVSVNYAKARNFEREAVNDERVLMRDALRRGMGEVTYAEVHQTFAHRQSAGEFLRVNSQKHATGQRFTTPETIAAELSNVSFMQKGQGAVEPIMRQGAVAAFALSRDALNSSQLRAIEDVLTSRDRVHGFQGYAGSGKTSALMMIRNGAEQNGHVVQGFAPTARAAGQLRDAGIQAETLQAFLTRSTQAHAQGDPNSRHLYMLDESSLASTQQMRAFLEKIGLQDRVLLVGDIRQHQGVDAGKPFEQMLMAGMSVATLDQIMRQKDPNLLKVVEHLSKGETTPAIQLLQEQGRVTEVIDRTPRFDLIARNYAASPVNTIVISPDNASRLELNQVIRGELQKTGLVSMESMSFNVLVQRSELSNADRKWAARYEPSDVLYYTRGSREHGIEPRSYAVVLEVRGKENEITVRHKDGQLVTYDPQRLHGITAYQEVVRDFAIGDRIQFTANNRQLAISNRQLGTIARVEPQEMVVRLDGEKTRTVAFDPTRMKHFDHGYAVTSHSSQGLTADRALVHVDSSSFKELLNQRFAYVAISRAAHDVHLYTNDASALRRVLGHDVSKSVALEERRDVSPPPHEQRKESTMSYRNEHAEQQQTHQPAQSLPPSLYVTQLDRDVVLQDVQQLAKNRDAGNDQADAKLAVEQRHWNRNGENLPLHQLTEKYAEGLSESVYRHPELTPTQHLAAALPTPDELRHWEPIVRALGMEQADGFTWRREEGSIQSYRMEEPRAWLHIDADGRFYDRYAQPLDPEIALGQFGISPTTVGANLAEAKSPDSHGNGFGLGV